MKPLRFHESARAELREATLFYSDRKTGLGERWLAIFETVIQKIRGNPGVGRPTGRQTRQYRVLDFPHAVVFQNRTNEVYIVAVTHLRRRPDHWMNRLGGAEP